MGPVGMNQDLVDFLDILTAWRFGYNTAWCKYFVSKTSEKNVLLYGMLAFTNAEITKGQKNLYIETSQCIAGQEIFGLTPDFYADFQNRLIGGQHIFKTKEQEFSLPLFQGQPCRLSFDPLNFPLINSTMRNPFLGISTRNEHSFIPDIKKTSLELRTLDTPYEDVQDLFHSLGFSMEILDSSHIPHFEYIVTMPLKDMQCSIENRRELHLNFLFPSVVEKGKFNVGIRLFGKDKPTQGSALLEKSFNGLVMVSNIRLPLQRNSRL